MHSEIINCLRMSDFPNSKFIIATKDVTSDVNFVFCELLSHYISGNYTIVLLNFAQSYAHYNHTLLKCNINMRQLRENQQILTIDGLSEIEKLTMMEVSEINQNAIFRDLVSDTKNTESLQSLYHVINNIIEKLLGESKQFVLFIDDINSLLNLGVSVNNIVSFVQYCCSLCYKDKDSRNTLLIGATYEKEDLLNKKLVNYLFHIADLKIQVEGLKTGYSKDVHGKITFTARNPNNYTVDCQKMLYKVTEEGAKLLTIQV